jgi:hypothetical protein
MRQNGLLAVHKYPWDEEMKKVFDLYSRLLW